MIRDLNDRLRRVPVPLVWVLGTIPFALLVFDAATNNLGVDPVQTIEHRLGRTAFYLLVAGLAVTPLLRLTGVSLMRFRRAIGVLCFGYAAGHVLSWAVIDMGLLWGQMGRDIVKRPYLLFGMLSFVAIFALGVTSNNLSLRRMGARAWRNLHRLVYPAAVLAGMHWLWAVKVNEMAPLVWTSLIVALLVLRVAIPRTRGRSA